MIILLVCVSLWLTSCSQPVDSIYTTEVVKPVVPVLAPEYAPFDGTFWSDMWWQGASMGDLRVVFTGNKARVTVMTRASGTIIYFNKTISLANGTITTYTGLYPIIWWFECTSYPYSWNADYTVLTVRDHVYDRTIVLVKEP